MLRRALLAGAVLAVTMSNVGCVPLAVVAIRSHKRNARMEEIQTQVAPLMGQNREDVIVALGPPSQVFEEGLVSVFRYAWNGSTHSFAAGGANASASCYGYTCNGYSSGTVGATAWQDSDTIDITFRNGVAISWRANVVR